MEEEKNNIQEPSSGIPQEARFKIPKVSGKVILLSILVLLIAAAVVWGVTQTGKSNLVRQKQQEVSQDAKQAQKTEVKKVSGSLVYGFWSTEKSIINVLDLHTNRNELLVALPLNIKHVKVISARMIAYIKNTDIYDRGTQIVFYDITSKKETIILSADPTFGIDDYVVSSDGKYLAAWEAKNGSGAQLLGGRSRVYALDTAAQEKHLLYDEVPGSSSPVHYPIAVTDAGQVFTDRFLANSGAGWGYGMSVSDFKGQDSTDILAMTNGTYSTQPVVSPDGKQLVFAGYDNRLGAGDEVINGYRRAIIYPNTISTFDLTTLQRRTVITAKGSDLYPFVYWNPQSNSILYTFTSKNYALSGTYILNPISAGSRRLIADTGADAVSLPTSVPVLTAVLGQTLLVSSKLTSFSSTGNLGSVYAQADSGMFLSGRNLEDKKELALSGSFTQYIGIMPQSYFTNVKNARVAEVGGDSKLNLQLETFSFKPELLPEREEQQVAPEPQTLPLPDQGTPVEQACFGPATVQCNTQCGTHYTPGTASSADNACFSSCFRNSLRTPHGGQVCGDSPLYLYGQKGTKVSVQVGAAVYTPNVPYDPGTGFDITLGGDSTFAANGKNVESISFDYSSPVKKLERPPYGSLVRGKDLKNVLADYSDKLGLNTRETKDLFSYANQHISSPFVFVSFYNHAMSQQILPLFFTPEPDNYRNIVFYFERFNNKPTFRIAPPVFEKVARSGFSAVEVSYILK